MHKWLPLLPLRNLNFGGEPEKATRSAIWILCDPELTVVRLSATTDTKARKSPHACQGSAVFWTWLLLEASKPGCSIPGPYTEDKVLGAQDFGNRRHGRPTERKKERSSLEELLTTRETSPERAVLRS